MSKRHELAKFRNMRYRIMLDVFMGPAREKFRYLTRPLDLSTAISKDNAW